MKNIEDIKENIFNLDDSMERACSYFEVINKCTDEVVTPFCYNMIMGPISLQTTKEKLCG